MKLKLPKRQRGCPHCAREAQIDSSRGAYMDWLLRQMAVRGWAVSGVADDALGPPWAFSIGLWASVGHADLAIFGRPVEQMRTIIDRLAERVSGPREAVISVGDELDDVCPSRLVVRPVHESWRETIMFLVSDAFHGCVRPPIHQVVWADRDGRFPGDAGFDPAQAAAQPMLWLPLDDHPPGPWTRLAARA
jgi:hypothetical protein